MSLAEIAPQQPFTARSVNKRTIHGTEFKSNYPDFHAPLSCGYDVHAGHISGFGSVSRGILPQIRIRRAHRFPE
jgi:hypothetical protein